MRGGGGQSKLSTAASGKRKIGKKGKLSEIKNRN
jgi:hypothetical protein